MLGEEDDANDPKRLFVRNHLYGIDLHCACTQVDYSRNLRVVRE
jgi:hypothetical protein